MRDDYAGGSPPTDNWQPVDNADIQVNVTSLKQYYEHIQQELDDFNANLKNGVTPLMKVQSTFAGFGEGKLYRGTHAKALFAVSDMLKDVSFSLAAIVQASAGIYFEYLGGDDLSKAKVDDVYDVFWPSDGRPTLQDQFKTDPAKTDDQTQQPYNGSANAAEHNQQMNPATASDPGSSLFNGWDNGFTVGDGDNKYTVGGNQSDMMGAPKDPMKND